MLVQEFVDVFHKDLYGLPFYREITFTIEKVLGTTPISKALHLVKMVEV